VPPADQRVPAQEPGVRRARPLPYDLDVTTRVGADGLTLVMRSRGRSGAVFHTRSREGGPSSTMRAQMFSVEAGRELSATFPTASPAGYDVEVHGPNGFYRHLAGGTAPGPEVSFEHAHRDQRRVVVTNFGPAADVTVVDHYGHGRRPTTHHLPHGGHLGLDVGDGVHGWYDLEITSHGDATFLRRLAGHLECGRPSISDPALGW
jgi:phospholipase C